MNRMRIAALGQLSTLSCCLAALGSDATPANDSRWPSSVTATVGDVLVRIDGPKLWTLSRIEYQGKLLGVEDSAYGTVINIKGVGFIGTAHKEVEPEQVTQLEFTLDDKPLARPAANIEGQRFSLRRESTIRSFRLDSVLDVHGNRIDQSVRLRTSSAVDLKVLYPLMYAWTPAASDYLFGTDAGSRVAGEFLAGAGPLRQISQDDMDWLAVYDRKSQTGVVSRVLARPRIGGSGLLIVDAPTVYRKFYVVCFSGAQVPAGFDGKYRVVSAFFSADEAAWTVSANRVAAELRSSPGRR